MKRGRRSLPKKNGGQLKYILYLSGITLAIMVITFIITVVIYNKNLKKYSVNSGISEEVSDLITGLETTETDTQIGKTIEEAVNEIKEENNIEDENRIVEKIEEIDNTIETAQDYVEEFIPDPTFIKPVDGEIILDFAKDNLIYSETLEEWVTHYGVDIKADRTTVVKASADGTVVAIKNDPRYGLTIIVEHENGYKTVYSNLLTTEFVEEGEIVTQGQSLGTVGNSAVFEIADEPHLHFEITKDGEYLDPKLYMN